MYWLDFLFNEHAVSYQKENIDLQTSLYKIYKTWEEEQQCEKEENEKKRKGIKKVEYSYSRIKYS